MLSLTVSAKKYAGSWLATVKVIAENDIVKEREEVTWGRTRKEATEKAMAWAMKGVK